MNPTASIDEFLLEEFCSRAVILELSCRVVIGMAALYSLKDQTEGNATLEIINK